MLTQDQIAQWHEEGYCMAPEFFSAEETAALQAEVQRLQDEGKLRNVATAGDGKTESTTEANLQLCPASPHSPLIKALTFADKVVNSVQALVGEDDKGAVRQLDQIFLKPGGHGAGTSWHQDNAYFGVLESEHGRGTGMWIAVHDAHEDNGTMKVIPNSHKTAMEHKRDGNSDHHIRCFPNEDKAVTCTLPAGGVVFFNYGVAHSTGPNVTDTARAGLAFHFHHKDIGLGEGQICGQVASGAAKPLLSAGGQDGWDEDLTGQFDRLVKNG